MKKTKILLLGATGSIGKNTIEIIRKYSSIFEITGISANLEERQLSGIADEFSVPVTGLASGGIVKRKGREIYSGNDVNKYLAQYCNYDILVNGLVGSVGFSPTYSAIKRDKVIALANKETIVSYGTIINRALKRSRASIRPVDSEHSALWQLLEQYGKDTERIVITASGGAALKHEGSELTMKEILKHPVWNMGKKVTIDSSTMANKGLEIMEAAMLFNINPARIDVLIHPQSVIHAMAVLFDGTVISHMAYPDMVLPIEYALFYPERPQTKMIKCLSLEKYGKLEFYKPDYKKYPALKTAYHAALSGSTYPAVFNAANEAAVYLFIKGLISFNDIHRIIDKAVRMHKPAIRISAAAISSIEDDVKKNIYKRFGL